MRDEDFKYLLEKGQAYEQYVIDNILNKYTVINTLDDYTGDIVVIDEFNREVTYEIKAVSDINNIFVEISSFGIPSGLSVSDADIYLFIDQYTYSYIEIYAWILHLYIKEREYIKKIKCGYKNQSECYVFDGMKFKDFMVDNCAILDD